jgi:outer membrane receptor protein involved in Fe transport
LLFDGPGSIANNSLSAKWRKALWKINSAYHLDDTDLLYATWSQGFRRGGVNALPLSEIGGTYITPQALTKLAPDTADNYEVGAKGTVHHRFSYSAAIYYIQWHNVQEGTFLTPLAVPTATNIGEALSRGLELELTASVSRHVTAKLGYTYDQTKLTSFNPLFVANATNPVPPPGGPLPGTPKNSITLSLEYAHNEFAGGEFAYAVDAHYRSTILSAISETALNAPGYTMLNSRVTFARSHWLATLYLDNITNTLGINAYSDPGTWGNRYQATVSRPRTIGLTFAYSLKDN